MITLKIFNIIKKYCGNKVTTKRKTYCKYYFDYQVEPVRNKHICRKEICPIIKEINDNIKIEIKLVK